MCHSEIKMCKFVSAITEDSRFDQTCKIVCTWVKIYLHPFNAIVISG